MFSKFVWAFLFVQVFLFHSSGANPDSRLATLVAMKDRGSFEIDRPDWTMDVSIGPDGKRYSNKAPGPILLSYPIFYLLDELVLRGIPKENAEARYQKRIKSKDAYYIPLCLIFQILPFVSVVLKLCALFISKFHLSREVVSVFFFTCLFANTASNFMNSFFGHGMAAVFLLAGGYALLVSNWFFVGLFFGFALLSDYGAACLFPGLIWIFFKNSKTLFKNMRFLLAGSFIPGLMWIFYHQLVFGGPFEIAIKFQDPSMHIVKNEAHNIWGVLSLLPKGEILFELLLGWSRGIMWTQPWVFMVLWALFFVKTKEKSLVVLKPILVSGFLFLLILNANFGGWWGGGSTGPRYLSIIFPLLALPIPFLWGGFSVNQKRLFWVLVAYSFLFWILVFSTSVHAPPTPLWPWVWSQFSTGKFERNFARLGVVLLSLGLAYYFSKKSESKLSKSPKNLKSRN